MRQKKFSFRVSKMVFPTLTRGGREGYRTAWFVRGINGTKAFLRRKPR